MGNNKMNSYFQKWVMFTKMNIEKKQFESIKEEEYNEKKYQPFRVF